jgi:FtsZ-binding cell division protein ZapB
MISLEQIRLLEQKVTSAVELIRVLKEENATLRRGLDSAQRRMKELETLVEGFKTDQREIESAIVRTLHNLDDLEESAAGAAGAAAASREKPPRHDASVRASAPADPKPAAPADTESNKPAGSELDIF